MWGWLTECSECDSLQAKVTSLRRFIRTLQGIRSEVYKSIRRTLFSTDKYLILVFIHNNTILFHNYVKNNFIFIIAFRTYFSINNVSIATISSLVFTIYLLDTDSHRTSPYETDNNHTVYTYSVLHYNNHTSYIHLIFPSVLPLIELTQSHYQVINQLHS